MSGIPGHLPQLCCLAVLQGSLKEATVRLCVGVAKGLVSRKLSSAYILQTSVKPLEVPQLISVVP